MSEKSRPSRDTPRLPSNPDLLFSRRKKTEKKISAKMDSASPQKLRAT
jgi:hypothetical protein